MDGRSKRGLGERMVHVISVGAFGEAVAQNLRGIRSDICETKAASCAKSMTWPLATAHVVATWRPTHELCYLVEKISYEQRRPFIPLVMDSRRLSLGPIVIPDAGACWTCSVKRYEQHSESLNFTSILHEYYDKHSNVGPEGYLEPFAIIGAERVSATIDALNSPHTLAGAIWQIDLLTLRITTGKVVGVDNCPRCGLHRPVEMRSVAEMQQALAHLLRF
jgi:bacteriocin biosynthesis cyclodehydratase domain-containing protein